jgi:Flp pilus assembly protein TadG
MRTGKRGGTRGDGDRGAFTLSYVIIFPVFLLALMVIAQASLLYLARQAALAAARQGADAARFEHAPAGAGTAAALSFATTVASGYLRAPAASESVSNQTVQITVTGSIFPLVPGMATDVSETAQAPVERFTVP